MVDYHAPSEHYLCDGSITGLLPLAVIVAAIEKPSLSGDIIKLWQVMI